MLGCDKGQPLKRLDQLLRRGLAECHRHTVVAAIDKAARHRLWKKHKKREKERTHKYSTAIRTTKKFTILPNSVRNIEISAPKSLDGLEEWVTEGKAILPLSNTSSEPISIKAGIKISDAYKVKMYFSRLRDDEEKEMFE